MTSLSLLIICLCHLLVICCGAHTQIGKHPDIWPNDCGSVRESQFQYNPCFRWHRVDIPMPRIMNGREALLGEAPYLVYILVKLYDQNQKLLNTRVCTGSLLNENIAVTAAHCFKYKSCIEQGLKCITKVELVFGQTKQLLINEILKTGKHQNLRVTQDFVLHPNYLANNSKSDAQSPNDMAIVYWREPVEMRRGKVWPVCLPEANITNDQFEYGMVSGWGAINNKYHVPKFLPMGWVLISPAVNNDTDFNGNLVICKYVPGGTFICVGDSGGPLIQYVDGRAVLTGTLYGTLYDTVNSACLHDDKEVMAFVRVSNKIEWLIKTSSAIRNSLNRTVEKEREH